MTENSVSPVAANTVASDRVHGVLTYVSLAVSTTTSLSTLLVSVAGDPEANVWLVGCASGLIALCLAVVFAVERKNEHRQKRTFWVAVTFSAVVLSVAWVLVFRDQIAFSRAFAAFSSKPAVLVDESVAWAPMSSQVTREKRRLAALIDETVTEPHQTSVFASSPSVDKQTLLIVSGVGSANRFSLTLERPVESGSGASKSGVPARVGNFQQVMDSLDNYAVFFASEFDSGPVRLSVSASASFMNEVVAAAYHLVTAVWMTRQASSRERAEHHLGEFFDQSLVFTADPDGDLDWILEGMVFAAGHYMKQRELPAALRFVRAARKLFPSSARLKAAEAYIEVNLDQADAAKQLLGDLNNGEFSRVTILRGVLEVRRGDYWAAATLLESAAAREQDATLRLHLHRAVAMLMATALGDSKKRGDRVRVHAAHALEISEGDVLVRLLQAYGWALVGNPAKSLGEFENLRRELQSKHDSEACEYWRALGFVALGKQSEALKNLVEFESNQPVGAPLLGLLAELHSAPPDEGYTERYLNSEEHERATDFASRAIALEENEPRSNRLIGFQKAALARKADRVLRRQLQQEALKHFDRAVKRGNADAAMYEEMADLNRELAQTVESRECAQKATELACLRDSDPGWCAVVEVRQLLANGDFEGAKRRTNELLSWFNAGRAESELYRSNALIQIAVAWYEADRLGPAEKMYVILTDYLERKADFPGRTQIMATVDCNLGFIMVDRHEGEEARRLFSRGVRSVKSADCEAGLAIASLQLGKKDAALQMYRRAKSHDPNYGNLDVLRTGYSWSSTACDLVQRLAAMDG